LSLAAGFDPAALFMGTVESNSGLDDLMSNLRFQSYQEMENRAVAAVAAMIDAAKPYLATILIVTVLLSIWIGLRAS
jgi:molybdopterin synthase catalytic subunit